MVQTNVFLVNKKTETMVHLFITCSFAKQVQQDMQQMVNRPRQWTRNTLLLCYESWEGNALTKHFKDTLLLSYESGEANTLTKHFKALPSYVTSKFWSIRNKIIFEGKIGSPSLVAHRI